MKTIKSADLAATVDRVYELCAGRELSDGELLDVLQADAERAAREGN